VILGVDALAEFARSWSSAVILGIAVYAILAAFADYRVVTDGDLPIVTAERVSLVAVARELAAEPHACLVVTDYQPEIGWYSRCATVGFAQAKQLRPPAGETVYVVLFQHGHGQPTAAKARKLLAGRDATTSTIQTKGSLGRATLISLTAAP
jgi:hypothetical protein